MIIEKVIYKLMKSVNITVLITCFIMYLIPFGAYHVWIEEDSTFSEKKEVSVAIMGVVVIFALLIHCLLRTKFKILSSIIVSIFAGIQLLFLGTENTESTYLLWLDNGRGRLFHLGIMNNLLKMKSRAALIDDWTPMHRIEFGFFLFDIITQLIYILRILSICTIVVCLVNLICKKIRKQGDIEEKRKIKEKFYKNKLMLLVRIINIIVGVRVIYFIFSYTYESYSNSFLELLSWKQDVLLGYAIPIFLFLLVFVDEWIDKGKWAYAVTSYGILLYIMYLVEFYSFDMFYDYGWDEIEQISYEFNYDLVIVIVIMLGVWAIESIIAMLKTEEGKYKSLCGILKDFMKKSQ